MTKIVNVRPYKIGKGNNDGTMRVTLSALTGANVGDEYYQYVTDTGIIKLVPKALCEGEVTFNEES